MFDQHETARLNALEHYYALERRAGASPLEANERMHFFAKRLDALFESKLDLVRKEMKDELNGLDLGRATSPDRD
jgi:hypothetical protein